jgi:hypothetical protein
VVRAAGGASPAVAAPPGDAETTALTEPAMASAEDGDVSWGPHRITVITVITKKRKNIWHAGKNTCDAAR